ncbi:Condensin complex subunit 2 [Brachionus plicatilis]|uniref:Condensin complex subunit 2 n=1 Tax=Brachionus plicatilis TaxID=10195 RepID=A0A3M7TAT3_BRAPC|nr:Condensin complex subunit 2 [Brachionus plicatilis]
MSLRRKTLLANELPLFGEVAENDVNDDVAEKRRRLSIHQNESSSAILQRKNRIIQENNELQKSLNGSSRQPLTPSTPKPSNEQLSCLYNNCVKLLNENKINTKNAFQLKLIDYMSDIVLNKEISGGDTNFQVVGCTIDVGTKIYAARVDALHQNTYQMLDGIRRSATNEDNSEMAEQTPDDFDGNGDMNDNDQGDQGNKKTKAKKKRNKKSSHIAENLDTITTKLRDDFQDEDLYFSKISTCIESEAIGGILLNKLHYQDDTTKLVINKDQKIDFISQTAPHNDQLNLKEIYQFNVNKNISFNNLKLCSELSNFRYIGWNLDNEDEITKLIQSMATPDENLEAHRFDVNNKNLFNLSNEAGIDNFDDDCLNNDVEADPDIENFGSDMNMTEAQRATSIHQSGMEMLEKIDDIRSMNSVNSIADLTTLISNSPSDYSYFNFDKLKLHDLPNHLKRMAIQIQSSGKSSDNMSNNTKLAKSGTVRSKKEAPRIDFTILTDISKFLKVTKKCIFLCDRTLEKRAEKPLWFESERQCDFDSKEFFRAYRKGTMAKIYTDANQEENLLGNDEIEIEKTLANRVENGVDDDDGHLGGMDDDFEMPCTAQTNEPFFTQNGHEFAQTQNFNQMDIQPQEMSTLPAFDAQNLVQAPLQVNSLNIEYAKTSKNIDVRRLKQVVWSLLLETDKQENTNQSQCGDKTRENFCINASLKEIYKQLRPPLISQKVFEDLSVCIVFQMLLFLANEHNLLLSNDPIGSDVIITNY